MLIKRAGENTLTYVLQKIKAALLLKVDKVDGKGLSTNDYTTTEKNKLAGLSNYTLPTASATTKGGVKIGAGLTITDDVLSVSSGGEADSVAWANITGKPDTFTPSAHNQAASTITGLATVATSGAYADLSGKPTIPTVPTISTNIETDSASDAKTASPKAVKTYIDSKVSAVYKPQGSVAFASLPSLSASVLGYVYNITNAFITTSDFVEGAGSSYPSGTNVVCVLISGSYKWDVLSGTVDLSGYTPTNENIELTNTEVDNIWTTVFGA